MSYPGSGRRRTPDVPPTRSVGKILLGLKNLVDAHRPARLIENDPNPQLSRLDRLDGLTGPDDVDDYDRIDDYLVRRRHRR